ncbi:MAG: protein kinase [Planctomycetes bacterium]|nr:protein kinase [Planctomycetota bacterium]
MTSLSGKKIGPFEILEPIGKGGMATVYKAHQASVDRFVAVKLLPADLSGDRTFVERFRREARTIAKLEHPHILPVYDHGEDGGMFYIAMRFLPGGSLRDRIDAKGPLALAEALRILEQVGGALGHAHRKGVLHRDIKPSNVLLDDRGDAFLSDFGLARPKVGSDLTAADHVVGTPMYMSPEQALGEKVDERSDLYALGVLLYEVLTGDLPFQSETPLAILMKKVKEPVPSPRLKRPELPESVERVVLKALARLPKDRHRSADEMVEELRRAIPPAAEAATVRDRLRLPTPQRLAPPPRPRRAKRAALLGSALAGAALLVSLALWFVLSRQERGPESGTPDREDAGPGDTAPPDNDSSVRPRPALPEPGWTAFITPDDVSAVAARDGWLWAGGSGGIVRWNVALRDRRRHTMADGLPSNEVFALHAQPDGTVWAGTVAGLARLDPGADRWTTYTTEDGLDSEVVVRLFGDRDGSFWALTINGDRGLNILSADGWEPPAVPPLPGEAKNCHAIARDRAGHLWVALDDGGLAELVDSLWREYKLPPDTYVADLLAPREGDLLAATSRGVFRFRGTGEGEWVPLPAFEGISTNILLEDLSGRLWFGGDDGLANVRPAPGRWRPHREMVGDGISWITSGVEDDRGALWFGTAGGGVVCLHDRRWERFRAEEILLPGNHVVTLAEDGEGGIWVRADSRPGFARLAPVAGTWEAHGEHTGAVEQPDFLAADAEGRIWTGEYDRVRTRQDGRWVPFAHAALGDVAVRSFARSDSGVLWFGLESGSAIRIDPESGESRVFTPGDGLPGPSVGRLLAPGDARVFALAGGRCAVFDGARWTPVLAGSGEIRDLALSPSGELAAAAGDSAFLLSEGKWRTFPSPDFEIARIAIAPGGAIWAGGEQGLGRLDFATGERTTVPLAASGLPAVVTALLAARDGSIWTGTPGGLGRYVPPAR